jgi:hypothetical protein
MSFVEPSENVISEQPSIIVDQSSAPEKRSKTPTNSSDSSPSKLD